MQLEKIFCPRSVAIVGVSSRLDNPGTLLLRSIMDMGFGAIVPGKLRAVIETVAADKNVDTILVVGGAPAYRKDDFGLMKMHSTEIKESFAAIDKPIVALGIPSGFAFSYMADLHFNGIPCHQTPGTACRALSRLLAYTGA